MKSVFALLMFGSMLGFAPGCESDGASSPEEEAEILQYQRIADELGVRYTGITLVESEEECGHDCRECTELPSRNFCFIEGWPHYCEDYAGFPGVQDVPDASMD